MKDISVYALHLIFSWPILSAWVQPCLYIDANSLCIKLLVGPDVVSHETQTQALPGNWGEDAGAVHVGTCV